MDDIQSPARVQKSTSQAEKAIAFFLRFLNQPKQVGSIIPSSAFLERRLVRTSAIAQARTVVELGPGTGGTTKALLKALPPDGHLLAIEIDRRLADIVRSEIRDPRLIVHQGSAEQIALALAQHDLPAPEVVISGIPFSTMPRQIGKKILREIRTALAPGGRFVAYQVRDRVAVLGRDFFGDAESDIELLNVPPIRIWCWRKRA
jgi:phosphatidylethanolamine/phosphatidyl-N-methylethanolamine N-methyltransferase